MRLTDGERENDVPERVLNRWQRIVATCQLWSDRLEAAENDYDAQLAKKQLKDWLRKLANYEAKMMARSYLPEGRYALKRLVGSAHSELSN